MIGRSGADERSPALGHSGGRPVTALDQSGAEELSLAIAQSLRFLQFLRCGAVALWRCGAVALWRFLVVGRIGALALPGGRSHRRSDARSH